MAQARLQFLLDLEDRVSPGMQKIKTDLDNFKGQVEKMQPAFKQMAVVGAAGFTAITGAVALSVRESMHAEAANMRLSQILKTTGLASDEQVAALGRQASALEQVGVVSSTAITQAQAQLATFDLMGDSIEALIPSILDYAVAEKGANIATEDLKGMTNGLAQALQGNFASLTRTGFVLDDATKELISTGTEAERVAAIVEVLNSTYEGFNEAARETTEGSIVAMKNEFSSLAATIGNQFMPIVKDLMTVVTPMLQKMGEWIRENPTLARNIIIVTGAIFGLLAVVGTIGLVLPAIITGFTALGTVIGFVGTAFTILTGPIGLIIAAIAALIAIVVLVVRNWEEISAFASEVWGTIKDAVVSATQAIGEMFVRIWEGIKSVFWSSVNFIIGLWAMLLDFLFPGWQEKLTQIFNKAVEIWNSIKAAFTNAFNAISGVFTPWIDAISAAWKAMWEGVKNVFIEIWQAIASVFDSVVSGIKSAMETLIAPIQRVIDLAQRALQLAGGAVKSVGGAISSTVRNIIERGASITGKAIGGPVLAGTPYMVGEHGPELFMPGQSGAIAPNGRFGGGEVNIYISGNTLLDRDAARKIGDQLVRYAKINQRI